MDTSGFYKNENDCLIYAPNAVFNANYELYKEQKNNYNLPLDGWYWFDNEDAAYNFFGLVKPQEINDSLINI